MLFGVTLALLSLQALALPACNKIPFLGEEAKRGQMLPARPGGHTRLATVSGRQGRGRRYVRGTGSLRLERIKADCTHSSAQPPLCQQVRPLQHPRTTPLPAAV